MYLIWILWVQVNSIEQPIKRKSVGPGNTSHCRTLQHPSRFSFHDVVLLATPDVMKVNGRDLMPEKKLPLLDKITHPPKCVTWKRFVRNSSSKYSIPSCRVMMCHFTAVCSSIASTSRSGVSNCKYGAFIVRSIGWTRCCWSDTPC